MPDTVGVASFCRQAPVCQMSDECTLTIGPRGMLEQRPHRWIIATYFTTGRRSLWTKGRTIPGEPGLTMCHASLVHRRIFRDESLEYRAGTARGGAHRYQHQT